MAPPGPLFHHCCFFWNGSDRSFQYVEELLNSSFFLFGEFALTAEKPGVEFGGEQSILKALDHPVDDGNHHLNVEIVSQFVALDAKTNKFHRSVGIFCDQETIDFAFEDEIRAVIAKKIDSVRDPIFMNQV